MKNKISSSSLPPDHNYFTDHTTISQEPKYLKYVDESNNRFTKNKIYKSTSNNEYVIVDDNSNDIKITWDFFPNIYWAIPTKDEIKEYENKNFMLEIGKKIKFIGEDNPKLTTGKIYEIYPYYNSLCIYYDDGTELVFRGGLLNNYNWVGVIDEEKTNVKIGDKFKWLLHSTPNDLKKDESYEVISVFDNGSIELELSKNNFIVLCKEDYTNILLWEYIPNITPDWIGYIQKYKWIRGEKIYVLRAYSNTNCISSSGKINKIESELGTYEEIMTEWDKFAKINNIKNFNIIVED